MSVLAAPLVRDRCGRLLETCNSARGRGVKLTPRQTERPLMGGAARAQLTVLILEMSGQFVMISASRSGRRLTQLDVS